MLPLGDSVLWSLEHAAKLFPKSAEYGAKCGFQAKIDKGKDHEDCDLIVFEAIGGESFLVKQETGPIANIRGHEVTEDIPVLVLRGPDSCSEPACLDRTLSMELGIDVQHPESEE